MLIPKVLMERRGGDIASMTSNKVVPLDYIILILSLYGL